MPLDCDVVADPEVVFARPDRLASLLRHAAACEASTANGAWQMTLRLSDDATIAALHDQFFADPTPTDVITFPSGESASAHGGYLGDIVVSVETAAAQASEGGHSTEREVAFLALHGLLHLCGHDDATPEGRSEMHERQSLLLELWERDTGEGW